MCGKHRPGVKSAAALAAGLRRRRTAVSPLLDLLSTGNGRQRAASCRALGWIGAKEAIPSITLAVRDRDWRVRMSAVKALAALHAEASRPEVEMLLWDRHRSVRMAAAQTMRRLVPGWRLAWR